MPFDWVSFSAMLLYGRDKSCMTISEQELHVGKDPAVLVLRRKGKTTVWQVMAGKSGWPKGNNDMARIRRLWGLSVSPGRRSTPSMASAPGASGKMDSISMHPLII